MRTGRWGERTVGMVALLLGAWVALAAGERAGADVRPLPDIRQLLSDVRGNQRRIQNLVDQYSCTEREEVQELDKKGQLKKTIVKEYEDFYLGGQPVRREVRKDGRSLSAEEQRKEDERVEKHIRDYEKKHGEEVGEAGRARREQADVLTFLRVSNFIRPRWEEYRRQEVIVFDFVPNPDYRPQKRVEELLHKLEGTVWVDAQARQVVRLEAHLNESFKVGGGLLASVRKGTSLVFEQAQTKDAVWLPSYVEAHYSARLLLFASAQGDYTSRFSDYKKFHVESQAHH